MPEKKALILSPFATVPLDAGQRKRVFQITELLKNFGYKITFVLYAFEDGWKTRANDDWIEEMRRQWGEILVWRANAKVGCPPIKGHLHGIDEWWDAVIETQIKEIFAYRTFDLFVVNNVWLSKAFEFAPRGTLRILDSHDVFSTRIPYFDPSKGPPEFFLTDAISEAHGANRADIVLGIQEHDSNWFARHTGVTSLCLPYDGAISQGREPSRKEYLHKDKVVFGFLGSAHAFNIRGLVAFCDELSRLVGRTAAPVELRLGGEVCKSIQAGGPWVVCGKVADEDAFFDQVDIMVAPIFEGSGFKVKVADAVAREKPIMVAAHAAIGLNFDKRAVANSAAELARIATHIALHRPPYSSFIDISRDAKTDLAARTARAARKLRRTIEAWPCAILYDLTGLSPDQASCVLLSWSGAFHLMRFLAKQLIVAPSSLRELGELAPPGVFFIPEPEVPQYKNQIWRWITVRNAIPDSWGANPLEVWRDPTWNGVFDDAPNSQPYMECQDTIFWHNITWDLMVQRIIKNAPSSARSSDNRERTIVIADPRRFDSLGRRIAAVFPATSITVIDTFAAFYELVIQVASGQLRRLVVIDPNNRGRVRILRQLCAIRGIEFNGMIDQGGLSLGRAPDWSVKKMYERFEKVWRLKRDDIMAANGKQGVQRRRALSR